MCPHKSRRGNASQSSHLTSFHASPSSFRICGLCVRFCIKLCCFIMKDDHFFFVFECVCTFRIYSGVSIRIVLWKCSSQREIYSHMICLTLELDLKDLLYTSTKLTASKVLSLSDNSCCSSSFRHFIFTLI